MPASSTHNGWRWDAGNNRLDAYARGTRIMSLSATKVLGILSVEATTSLVAGTTIAAGTTITAGTGLTVTTGNTVNTAGDDRITAGNVRLGVVSTFGTTEPTSAVIMKQGTAPAGAITTSAGIFTDGTAVRKIIAAGTVTNVET